MVELCAGRVRSKRQLPILQQKLSILLHQMRQRRPFGSRSSLLNLGLSLALRTQWISIVTTMDPSRKLRSLDLTNDPNTYSDVFTAFERSSIEVIDVKICRVPTDDNIADPL